RTSSRLVPRASASRTNACRSGFTGAQSAARRVARPPTRAPFHRARLLGGFVVTTAGRVGGLEKCPPELRLRVQQAVQGGECGEAGDRVVGDYTPATRQGLRLVRAERLPDVE